MSPSTPDGTTYPAPRFRVAVVQVEPIHEDVLPAVVHLLRLNGGDVTVYLNELVRTNRPGFKVRFPDIGPLTRFVPMNSKADWRRLARKVTNSSPDLMVMNTFQFNAPSNWAHFWEGPMLGVVHNPDRMRAAEDSMALVRRGRVGLVTLAPHVTTNLMASDTELFASVATITMTFPRPPKVKVVRPDSRRRIAVPGTVNFDARDYEQIVAAVPRMLEHADPGSFDIAIVGPGADRPALEEMVRDAGLSQYFTFAPLNDQGFVSGDVFYGYLRGSTFLLPSLPADDTTYRVSKITASIPNSIGLGIPAIIDRWTAAVYGIPAVTYTGDAIGDGLVRAMSMTDAELDEVREDLQDFGRLEQHRATAEMGFALRSLGLPG
ncbi:MAG TPA: hypothetical protein VFK41_11075 [Nocardioidaceae bacterium]|nr:hypothetical protein [Nocardioidaceae bacterium]